MSITATNIVTTKEHPPLPCSAQATISSLWNAAYAVGWAVGPLVGGWLADALKNIPLCTDKQARPPHCPLISDALSSTLSPGNSWACSCEWRPQNGFDGFASCIVVVCLVYALLLGVAVVCNVRGGSRSVSPLGSIPSQTEHIHTVTPITLAPEQRES